MTICLSEFSLTDYDAAFALWQNSAPGIGIGRSDTRDEIVKKLARDPDLFLVAEEETSQVSQDFGSLASRRIIGTVIGGFDGRRGLVYHLAVEPAYRQRGIGKMLMNEIESRLKAKGCLKCYLLVLPDASDAIEFYNQLGWEVMPVTIMAKLFG